MALSVNTNVGAMTALQTLNATNRSLTTTQSRINTGLNVTSTKDDSAKYTIAQQLRGELGGLAAVTSSLNNAKSVTGRRHLRRRADLRRSEQDEGPDGPVQGQRQRSLVDRIQKDFAAYQEQIKNIITSSGFNGINLLAGSSAGGSSTSAIISLQGSTVTSTTWDFETPGPRQRRPDHGARQRDGSRA